MIWLAIKFYFHIRGIMVCVKHPEVTQNATTCDL